MTRQSGFAIRKVLQVPNTGDKTLGVLMVMNKIGGDFSELDEALASSMAVIIALAIDIDHQQLKEFRDDLRKTLIVPAWRSLPRWTWIIYSRW